MFGRSEEQEQRRRQAAELALRVIAPRAAETDRSERYPFANVAALTEAGFLGMTIPEAHGGQGLACLDAVLVIEEIAKVCGVTARIVVEANLGAIGAITAYGSRRQIERVAPLVLAGDKPAICITEPEAGSAATEMATTAVRQGDHYRLNGKKHWITGGGVSQVHLIFARLIEDGRDQGIAGFIAVRGEDQGLKVGRREPTMGLRGIPETEILLEDLAVPLDMAVIPPGGPERGFAGLMNAYNGQLLFARRETGRCHLFASLDYLAPIGLGVLARESNGHSGGDDPKTVDTEDGPDWEKRRHENRDRNG
jgi:alkylation response protein AidB-like acyl-CoA dehydrogenase